MARREGADGQKRRGLRGRSQNWAAHLLKRREASGTRGEGERGEITLELCQGRYSFEMLSGVLLVTLPPVWLKAEFFVLKMPPPAWAAVFPVTAPL